MSRPLRNKYIPDETSCALYSALAQIDAMDSDSLLKRNLPIFRFDWKFREEIPQDVHISELVGSYNPLDDVVFQARQLGGNFTVLANNMENNPDYGIWLGFSLAPPDLSCRFCGKVVKFRKSKRWQNLSQHLARCHPREIPNCLGLPLKEQKKWLSRQLK